MKHKMRSKTCSGLDERALGFHWMSWTGATSCRHVYASLTLEDRTQLAGMVTATSGKNDGKSASRLGLARHGLKAKEVRQK